MLLTKIKFEEAKMLAVRMHGLQEYDNFPYHKHLSDVDNVLVRFGYTDWKFRIAAWLHDILEDTPLNYNDIKRAFGLEVAEMVFCVSDAMERTRDEKKISTLPRTRSNEDAIILKLGDRIANMENSIASGHSMSGKYAKEFNGFKDALYIPGHCEAMWDCLDKMVTTPA